MKLNTTASIEFKNSSFIPTQTPTANIQGQMIAPGGSCCTIGCSCSSSCGAVNKSE